MQLRPHESCVSPIDVITGTLAYAEATLLLDADHHNVTIAHFLPPLSNAMCAGKRHHLRRPPARHPLPQGHHSIQEFPWIVGLFFGALVALFAPQDQYWFIIAMGVGTAIHIVGDMLTTGGCNLVWPLTIKPPKTLHKIPVAKDIWKPNGYLAFPILGNAGSVREWILCIPVAGYAVIGIYATLGILASEGAKSVVDLIGLGK